MTPIEKLQEIMDREVTMLHDLSSDGPLAEKELKRLETVVRVVKLLQSRALADGEKALPEQQLSLADLVGLAKGM